MLRLGYSCYVLDGDTVRKGLNADLGFSAQDRGENVRRVGEVAALFADAGLICIAALISPYRNDRARARRACKTNFHEIYVKSDLATCEARDPKGLYRLARSGELEEFTGVNAPYEIPEEPEFVVDTAHTDLEECVASLLSYTTHYIPMHRDQTCAPSFNLKAN
ncbi:MAG: adenylyl-sulfate kinase [Pseudomonas sp.]|nr:adenylyl-sulfate kinase [Pseudomonas sp.]